MTFSIYQLMQMELIETDVSVRWARDAEALLGGLSHQSRALSKFVLVGEQHLA